MSMTPAMREQMEDISVLAPEVQDELAAIIRETLLADQRWEELFADPRSEAVFAMLAAEARETAEEDLWDLEASL